MFNKNMVFRSILIFILTVSFSGCAVNFYKNSPKSKRQIKELKGEISRLEDLRTEEEEKFKSVKNMLEKNLSAEIRDNQISLDMRDGILVILLSDNILFDSGKAEIKEDAYPVLNKVSAVIKNEVPKKDINIGGHTDNVPITYSKWKTNWELSSARATNVLHYLEDQGISPERLSSTGYGEHRPISPNTTSLGRGKNRRVEILIIPQYVEKVSFEESKEYIK